MDTPTFLANFAPIASAPNGVQRLRELIALVPTLRDWERIRIYRL